MSSRLKSTHLRLWFAGLYMLAMAVLGFAHKPVLAENVRPAEVVAFALPDGSLLPFCGPGVMPGEGDHTGTAGCDACLLTGAPGLPVAATMLLDTGLAARAPAPSAADQHRPGTLERGPTSRGPPAARA